MKTIQKIEKWFRYESETKIWNVSFALGTLFLHLSPVNPASFELYFPEFKKPVYNMHHFIYH